MMPFTRRTRGTPDSKAVEAFWNVVKSGLVVGGAVGSLSQHPALGLLSIGAETINQVQTWIAGRRSNELAEEVADGLYLAYETGRFTTEQVQQVIASEQFNSALLQARLIATRTHQKEKLEALRDAVLNVAAGTEPDEDRQMLFLNLLDRYDKLHLRLLRFFQEPAERGFRRPEGVAAAHTPIYTVVLNALPDLSDQLKGKTDDENFAIGAGIQLRIQDLANDRLVGIKGPFDTIPNFSSPHWTTGLGNAFLRFITADVKSDHE